MRDRFVMPVTYHGLRKYDSLRAEQAIQLAWNEKGNEPRAHDEAQKVVRDAMPLLARALDRLK